MAIPGYFYSFFLVSLLEGVWSPGLRHTQKRYREISCCGLRYKAGLLEATAGPYTHIPLHHVQGASPKAGAGPKRPLPGKSQPSIRDKSFGSLFWVAWAFPFGALGEIHLPNGEEA